MPIVDTDKMMTCAEAAKFLGLATDSVKKYCQKGTIEGLKFGRMWMISRNEVKRYKKENLGNHGRES